MNVHRAFGLHTASATLGDQLRKMTWVPSYRGFDTEVHTPKECSNEKAMQYIEGNHPIRTKKTAHNKGFQKRRGKTISDIISFWRGEKATNSCI